MIFSCNFAQISIRKLFHLLLMIKLKEGGDPERLDITFGGTALHAAVASNEDDQARGIIFIFIIIIIIIIINMASNGKDLAREVIFVESPTTHQS